MARTSTNAGSSTAARGGLAPRASGLLAAVACFGAWGLVPIYWKQIPYVSADEMVTHRVIWTLAFLAIVLGVRRSWPEVRAQWSLRTLGWAALAGITVSFNWWLFLWAVNHGRIIDTSLGYFLMPLFNLVIGLALFRERLRPLQVAAVAIATAGVAYAFTARAGLPWVGLALCVSFGLYGALRKHSHLESLLGLFFETLAVGPLAILWLAAQTRSGAVTFGAHDLRASAYLIGGGVITALPLLWFSHAARRLPLSTVGFLQYITPSITFLLGVLRYGEPVGTARLIPFLFVWSALALFTAEAAWQRRHAAAQRGSWADGGEPPAG